MSFTSKLNSHPSECLAQFTPKLPSPFVVAIMGASRNIGAATAKAFAQAGATGLILTGATDSPGLRDTKKEVEAAASFPDIKVTVLAADIGDPSSAKHVADTIESSYGRLDLLINNAAVVSTNKSAFNKPESIGLEQISKMMQINFVGKFAVVQALLPLLLKSEGGAKTIVNVTSALAHFVNMGPIGYNISELATNRMTEAIAAAYGAEGLLAFAVHPGVVATMPPPIGMEVRPMATDDVGLCGAFLLWLVKERRQWLSGRYLSANWDVDELEAKKDVIVSNDQLKMRMVV